MARQGKHFQHCWAMAVAPWMVQLSRALLRNMQQQKLQQVAVHLARQRMRTDSGLDLVSVRVHR